MREQILEEINQASQNNQKKVKEIESQSTDDLGFIKERIQKLNMLVSQKTDKRDFQEFYRNVYDTFTPIDDLFELRKEVDGKTNTKQSSKLKEGFDDHM